jgi:hypothetical protein
VDLHWTDTLGLEGVELRQFVTQQQSDERTRRAEEREAEKELKEIEAAMKIGKLNFDVWMFSRPTILVDLLVVSILVTTVHLIELRQSNCQCLKKIKTI